MITHSSALWPLGRVHATWPQSSYGICMNHCNCSGGGAVVKTVVDGSPQPYGLTVFRESVYWADWKTGTIERADKDTGEDI